MLMGELSLSEQIALLETAKRRWMSGGDADTEGNLLASGQSGQEAQLRLLAQAAVIGQICLTPERPDGLTFRSVLPNFDLPFLPDELRPLFRRLNKPGQVGGLRDNVIALMSTRGVVAHPFDWLPPKDAGDVPAGYAPIQAWMNGEVGARESGPITVENWDLFTPADRLDAAGALRRSDPAAARRLFEAKAATTPAEERLRLIRLLAENLGPEDLRYLESLSNDRSGKVRDISRQFLARLGKVFGGEDARELADFVQVKKGLLTRRPQFAVKGKLNATQRTRMLALFQHVAVADFADGLGHSTSELAKGWTFAESGIDLMLFRAFCETGADEDLRLFWERALAEKVADLRYVQVAVPRFERAERAEICEKLLDTGQITHVAGIQDVIGVNVPAGVARALLETPQVREAIARARQAANDRDQTERSAIVQLQSLISTLATLLPRSYAQQLYDQVAGAVFHPADPALDPLIFNISLEGPNP